MKWMSVREFLRGGYKTITEPTVVANHGRPAFTVFPQPGWTRKKAERITKLMTEDASGFFNDEDPTSTP